ncbi:MAG TPA: hypothetical protein VF467_04480, partial [Afipia sp.]
IARLRDKPRVRLFRGSRPTVSNACLICAKRLKQPIGLRAAAWHFQTNNVYFPGANPLTVH